MSKTIELPDGTSHTITDEELERGEDITRLLAIEMAIQTWDRRA